MNVPPTSTPIRAAIVAHLRFAIANCIAGEHRANCRRMEGPADAHLPARGARVDRAAGGAHAPRADRRRAAAGGDAARPARPRAAARRLADPGPRRPEPARARGLRRRHPDRPRRREPADARGLRGDLRGTARASRASRPGSAPAPCGRGGDRAHEGDAPRPAAARRGAGRAASTCASAGSSTRRATGRAGGSGSSTRSSGCSGGPTATTASSSPRRSGSASRSAATRSSSPPARRTTAKRAEQVVQESIRWAFERAADERPLRDGERVSTALDGGVEALREALGADAVRDGDSERDLHGADLSFHAPQPPRPRRLPGLDRRGRPGARGRRPSIGSR